MQIAGADFETISRREVHEADLYGNEEGWKSRWNLTRRIWAQRRLSSLERQADATRIREFAEAERMVSDYTSLIVLELMADHVRYRIPPPEPALLEEYRRLIEGKDDMTHRLLDQAWRQKLVWHRTEFPWIDADLENKISIVSVWAKASRTAFTEEFLNGKEVQSYEDWLDAARKVTAAKSALSGSDEFRDWSQQLQKRTAELAALRKQPPLLPKNNGPIHVSVRGFVNERGIFSGTPEGPEALTLERALEIAGGPSYFGSWSRVYLYRDAERTGYNLRSDQYIDVPLQWGGHGGDGE